METNKLNTTMSRLAEVTIKFRYLNLILFFLVLGFAFTGLSKISTDSGWDKWLLDKSPLKHAEDEFKEIFGNNDYVAVLVESDNIFQPEILEKIRELGNELKQNIPFADDVLSVTDCEFTTGAKDEIKIINLVPQIIPTNKNELDNIKKMALSKELLNGKLVSADSTESWIILRLFPFPKNYRNKQNIPPDIEIGTIADKIIYQDKYKSLNPKSAGLPVIAANKMMFIKKEMKRIMLLSVIVSIIVLAVSLKSFRGVSISIFTAVSSIIILFGFQGHFGKPIDSSIMLVPVYLGMAVSVAYSIHVFTFFNKNFHKTGKRKESVVHALEEIGQPIMFTALTTIAALASFMLIDIKPVRWVGAASAFTVIIILITTIFIIPSFISIGKNRKIKPVKVKKHKYQTIEKAMENLGIFVLNHSRSSIIVFIVIFTALVAGLANFEVSFDIKKTIGLKVPYVKKLDHVNNTEVGSLYSYNLIVNFPENGLAREPENLKKFEMLMQFADSQEYTKRTSSIVEIIKDMNRTLNEGSQNFYKIPDSRQMTAQIMLLYENAGGKEAEKWIDYDYKRLRMMVELSDYNSNNLKKEILQIQEKAKALFPASEISIAGSVAQFTFMQDIVSRGQVKSFLTALVLISLMMAAVTGSIKTGLIAMIPNITPALAVGGIMGFFGIPLDIFTITIMPMLLGLAVDDTIHFISHSKLEFSRTKNYDISIINTFKSTGIPIFFTSIIISANFLAYTTSPAKIYSNLGFLTSIGIMAALLADFFVTPVLIKKFKAFGKEDEIAEQIEFDSLLTQGQNS
jgi:hypothetical protein